MFIVGEFRVITFISLLSMSSMSLVKAAPSWVTTSTASPKTEEEEELD